MKLQIKVELAEEDVIQAIEEYCRNAEGSIPTNAVMKDVDWSGPLTVVFHSKETLPGTLERIEVKPVTPIVPVSDHSLEDDVPF